MAWCTKRGGARGAQGGAQAVRCACSELIHLTSTWSLLLVPTVTRTDVHSQVRMIAIGKNDRCKARLYCRSRACVFV